MKADRKELELASSPYTSNYTISNPALENSRKKEHSSTPLIPFAEKKKREGHRLPPSSLDQVSREKEGEGGGLVEQIGTNDRRKAVKASLYIRVEAVEPR